MYLACTEKFTASNYAPQDPVIFKDTRVLMNLLRDEALYTPQINYFDEIQTDIEPYMRKVVSTWMLEVCEEQMCEDQVLPLAVNLMDRFLCICDIKRQQLQLLGATCLLIASKVRCTNILPIDLLCAYTDYSVSYDLMVNWEILVLSKLKWNVASITGFDYIDQIIERSSWGQESSLLRRHAHTLVSICYTGVVGKGTHRNGRYFTKLGNNGAFALNGNFGDTIAQGEPSLIQTSPSAIAAACMCSAVRGLRLTAAEAATADLCLLTNLDRVSLEVLVRIVDSTVEKAVAKSPEKSVEGFESPQYSQPETPTEVENIYF